MKADAFEGGTRGLSMVSQPEKVLGGAVYKEAICLTDAVSHYGFSQETLWKATQVLSMNDFQCF